MCYNIQQKERKIVKYLLDRGMVIRDGRSDSEIYKEYHTVSGFTHPNLVVIESNNIQMFNWGLIPSWCKDEVKAKELAVMTLNAKSETVFEKPSFRSILKKRCVLPVDGFFEWQTEGKNKFPYFIYLKSEEPLFLGCLYDTWVNNQTGEIINGFSIITTEANELLAEIHNTKKRMPLILNEDKISKWNDVNTTKEDLQTLMVPYDSSLMGAHTISKRITDRSQNPNVPEVIEPFSYS